MGLFRIHEKDSNEGMMCYQEARYISKNGSRVLTGENREGAAPEKCFPFTYVDVSKKNHPLKYQNLSFNLSFVTRWAS